MRAMQILRLISSRELQPTAGETDRRTCFVALESRGLTCVAGEPSAGLAVAVSASGVLGNGGRPFTVLRHLSRFCRLTA